ncbi:MAG: hypothetical protein AB7F19_02345 [Candidatus Babeliales bacterium]
MKRVFYLNLFFILMFGQIHSYPDNSYNEFRNNSSRSHENITFFHRVLGFVAGAYYWCRGESEVKKKEKRFEKDRRWQDSVYTGWDADKFAENFQYNRYTFEWSYSEDLLDDPIFRKTSFYRFSGFRDFLRWSPFYQKRVLQFKTEIEQGKVFEIEGCSHNEFKAIIMDMASEFSYCSSQYDYGSVSSVHKQKLQPTKIESKPVAPKQNKDELLKSQIAAVMQQPENDLLADYAWYQGIETTELNEPMTLQEKFLVKRIDALSAYQQGVVSWKEETYSVSSDVTHLLKDHSIDTASYTLLYGNQVQHVLHQEMLSILADTADLRCNGNLGDRKNLTTTLTHFAHAGTQHNQAGHIKNACTFADFCWGVINCIKEAYAFECELENAIGRGAVKGGKNFIDKVRNPIKTLRDTRNNIRNLAYLVVELTEDVKYRAYLSIKNALKETAQELKDRWHGTYVAPPVEEIGLAELAQAFEQYAQKVGYVLNGAWNNLTKENVLYAAEEGTALATDMALTQVTLSAFSSLAINGSGALKSIIEAGGGSQNFMDLPFNAGSFEAAITYEAIIAAERAAAIEAAGQAAAAAIDKAAKVAPLAVFAQNAGSGGDGSNIPVSGGGNIPNPPMDIIQAMKPLSDAEHLEASKHIQQITHNGHLIIPPFDHTWVAMVGKNGEIIGFHQDRNGFYEKLGLIKDIELFADDFYRAKVFINGKWVKRSFFPKKWDTSDLMKCYYGIIKEPDEVIQQLGKTLYRSELKNKIKISAVINDSNGCGITFFANLRNL